MNESPTKPVLNDEAALVDTLGRDRFVATLTEVLREAETPMVVGLYGTWGSGKTSMMKQIRRALHADDARKEHLATVWFVPWEHSRDDQPGVSLLLAIRRDLGLEGVQVERALRAIALAIADDISIPYVGLSLGRVRSNYQQLAQQDIEKRSEQAQLREHFKSVINCARKGPKGDRKLVIFIDDLDRCQPATAVAMLEALKLFLNLEGCAFVLGIDRQPIEAAIAREYADLGIAKENYLDKIVQLPFAIPVLGKQHVDAYVAAHLPEHLRECQQMLAIAAPDNPRQLKRLINAFLLLDRIAASSFPSRDSVMLCAVALIQNSAPDLYQHLRHKPDDWTLLVPAGIGSQEPSPRPRWLEEMLSGTDARDALSAALLVLRRLHPSVSSGVVNIQPYVELSGQVASRSPGGELTAPVESADDLLSQAPLSRLDDAVALYQRAADEQAKQTGPDDPQTLTARQNLANAYLAAGRIDEAIALLATVVDGFKRVVGPDKAEMFTALASLASAYQAADRIDDSIALYLQAIDGLRRVLGSDHPDTITAEASLANAYHIAGLIGEAIALYVQAVSGMNRVLGPTHPTTMTTQIGLANAYKDEGRLPEARVLGSQAVDEMIRVLGPDHPNTLAGEVSLADIYQAAGLRDDAIVAFRQAIAGMRRVLGPDHPSTVAAEARLAAAESGAPDMA